MSDPDNKTASIAITVGKITVTGNRTLWAKGKFAMYDLRGPVSSTGYRSIQLGSMGLDNSTPADWDRLLILEAEQLVPAYYAKLTKYLTYKASGRRWTECDEAPTSQEPTDRLCYKCGHSFDDHVINSKHVLICMCSNCKEC